MSDVKDPVVAAHAEDSYPVEPADNKGQSIVTGNQALDRFQKNQHSLSVKEALIESWKPLMWCKSSCPTTRR